MEVSCDKARLACALCVVSGSFLIPLGHRSATHGVVVGPDGAPWVTDGGQNAIVRVDPANLDVTLFPLPGAYANLNTRLFQVSRPTDPTPFPSPTRRGECLGHRCRLAATIFVNGTRLSCGVMLPATGHAFR